MGSKPGHIPPGGSQGPLTLPTWLPMDTSIGQEPGQPEGPNIPHPGQWASAGGPETGLWGGAGFRARCSPDQQYEPRQVPAQE